MDFSTDREQRRIKRKVKKRRQMIVTLTIIVIMISVGVVSAQTQGFEIFYQGESLGFVKSSGIFDDAVDEITAKYQRAYGIEDIIVGQDVELVACRVEDSLDVQTCMDALLQADIEIYTNGLVVLCDDQVVGTMASLDEANRLADAYAQIYPESGSLVLIPQTATLNETSDFQTVLNHIKAIK
ncbi:hypothetical protein Q5O14_12525 [Eubacteriaceae bacterium ES2]|nr:hypothetical protein Q5O14_12525 [Eubacteriaceae bacterium ES2]